ncbi:MAG: 4'-phosphopantetheinyl transferase superfamily protein [Planctomycetes bacterium]|nr:4'-phosphopantetheinyl transferase superfamily protein [Planctomycetota bacterium]
MILQPVLMPVPSAQLRRGPERLAVQRRVSRLALAECARRCGLAHRDWPKDAGDVPQPSGGYHWSISHKPTWAAAVIADQPVGIDLEQIKPRHPHLFDGVGEGLEWALLGEQNWDNFFRLWTAKEATCKANGVGIGGMGHCRLIEIRDADHVVMSYKGRPWLVEHFRHLDHLAAVTVVAATIRWQVVDRPGGDDRSGRVGG